jgi:heptaprenyl diphosphate synthase
MGALTARLDDNESAALSEFGRCFGMVYQLRDDILDVVATENQLGKPAGQDLAEGIYNLPTLFALRDPTLGDELSGLLGAVLNDDDRERARKLVIATDGIAQTIGAAQSFLAVARGALEGVRSEPLREGFGTLIEHLLEDLPSY